MSCTIQALVTPDVPSRTVTVSLLGQTVATATTPPLNPPDTATRQIVVTVSQSLGQLVGYGAGSCAADFWVGPGEAGVLVTVDGTELLGTTVNAPAIGDVISVGAC